MFGRLAKAFPVRAFVFTNAWTCIVCVERFPSGNAQTSDCLLRKQFKQTIGETHQRVIVCFGKQLS